jgi:hypothetical protein
MQARLLKALRVDETVNVNDVDQLKRSVRVDASLTRSKGTDAQVARDDGCQTVVQCVVQIDALLDCDIEVDLLRVAGRSGGLSGYSKWAHLSIYSACGPQEIRK